MYPIFCRFRAPDQPDDRYVAAVAQEFGLGAWRPGLALAARGTGIEVLVGVDGRTALLPAEAVALGLDEAVALALLDAAEEALEDAEEQPDPALSAAAVRATLDRLERALGDEGMAAP